MHRARNKASIRLGIAPTKKWAGRVSEQGHFEGTEEEVEKGKGKLVRGNPENIVVVSHHPAVDRWWMWGHVSWVP